MKKILFVALAATLLAAGCQKTEIINPVGNAIGFSTGLNKLTKASDADSTGTVNLQEQNFRVWAYGAYEDPNTTTEEQNAIYDGIENLAVNYAAATTSWGTAQEYYWPGVEKELKFFAVSADAAFLGTSGATSTSVAVTPGETLAAATMTITDFVVENDVTKGGPNADLMVADFVQQHQGDKVVDLTFHHALSKVEFVFKTLAATGTETAPQVYVQSLSVANLANKGTLTVAAPAAATADETTGEGTDEGTTQSYQATVQPVALEWGTPTGTVAFTDDWNKEVTLPEGVDATAATDNKAMLLTVEPQTFTTWLMLPQSIDGKKVSITYIINKRQFTSIFALDKDNLKVWDDNQHIKYTVTLAPNVISFNPSVQDWANPTDREYQN